MKKDYKQVILETLRLLREDTKKDVMDFLDSIQGYKYTKIEVSLKGYYTSRLYKQDLAYDYDQSTMIEIIPNRNVGGQEIEFINLKEPISQQVIDAVDRAVEKQFPTFERHSGNVDSFIQWKDGQQESLGTDAPEEDELDQETSSVENQLEI